MPAAGGAAGALDPVQLMPAAGGAAGALDPVQDPGPERFSTVKF